MACTPPCAPRSTSRRVTSSTNSGTPPVRSLDALDHLGGQGVARGDLADHAAHLRPVERRKRDDAVMRAHRPGRAEFGPRGREDHQRRLRAALDQRAQEIERGRIGPVEVLDRRARPAGSARRRDTRRPSPRAAGAGIPPAPGRTSARAQRNVEQRSEQGRGLRRVEPDQRERQLEVGEPLFARDVRSRRTAGGPIRRSDAAACSAAVATTPIRPRCAASSQFRPELLDQPRLAEAGSPTICTNWPSP